MKPEEIIKKALEGDEKTIWFTAIMMLESLACKTRKAKYQRRAYTLLKESKERGIKWN